MLTPTIFKSFGHLRFSSHEKVNRVPSTHVFKPTDFAVTGYPVEFEDPDYVHVHVAVKDQNHWQVVKASAGFNVGSLSLRPNHGESFDLLAFPVDPRMTAEDINGATHIFANADNTGWLFSHASPANHHDHEITLMAGIDGVFQPLFRQYHVDVITGANLNIKQRATALYALLSQFYGEVINLARKNARAVVLGHRHKTLHPEEGHLHSEIKTAFEATKTKWLADRATDATKLATAFTYIGTVLTIPTPETRWDKAARLEAEAKKKKAAAEAEATQTPTESSGQ